jgi:hypothetical protein
MVERRELERFDLRLPGTIKVLDQTKEIITLFTRNICAGGAFFESTRHLPENSRVKIDLLVPTGVQIKVTGAVLRSEQSGMAIRFDKAYNITPLKQLPSDQT